MDLGIALTNDGKHRLEPQQQEGIDSKRIDHKCIGIYHVERTCQATVNSSPSVQGLNVLACVRCRRSKARTVAGILAKTAVCRVVTTSGCTSFALLPEGLFLWKARARYGATVERYVHRCMHCVDQALSRIPR